MENENKDEVIAEEVDTVSDQEAGSVTQDVESTNGQEDSGEEASDSGESVG